MDAPAIETSWTVPHDHPAFEGHFPGHPLLPGVVLLTEALAAIAAAGVNPGREWTVESAKFLSPVAPGTQLAILHTAQPSGSIRFEIRAGERRVASGVVSGRSR